MKRTLRSYNVASSVFRKIARMAHLPAEIKAQLYPMAMRMDLIYKPYRRLKAEGTLGVVK